MESVCFIFVFASIHWSFHLGDEEGTRRGGRAKEMDRQGIWLALNANYSRNVRSVWRCGGRAGAHPQPKVYV